MPNLNPMELAEDLDRAIELGHHAWTVDRRHMLIFAAALRLAQAAADPNFPRLELGKLRTAYIEARRA